MAIALFDLLVAALCLIPIYYLGEDLSRRSLRSFSQHPRDHVVFIGIFLAVAALHLVSAHGLLRLRRRARILRIVLASAETAAFPIGTLVSPPILLYLLLPGVKLLFAGRGPGELTAEETEATVHPWKTRNRPLTWSILGIWLSLAGLSCYVIGSSIRHAGERARVKRTISDLRAMATALDAYREVHGVYPPARTMDELAGYLVPTYLVRLPLEDHWKHPYRYLAHAENAGAGQARGYIVASSGNDGRWEREQLAEYPVSLTYSPVGDYAADIVLRDGSFIQVMEPRVD